MGRRGPRGRHQAGVGPQRHHRYSIVPGHRGNVLLELSPENFMLNILEHVSPDLEADDVIKLESGSKSRLHAHSPSGLNDN
jgi:hypothetical protein